ncbi:GNAT family N-acetyltransferase [Streptomyces sp. ICBB 8177]|uniref:GNAT family N-acetyltransferase n=1 Tax=Streptomyces sp. ICBB 8177 TaxID=563922 RepID=UPI000D6725DD|nr:GNAT family N-acetyltransferase [Streptomyces sp. ICBB 8177]PWI44900.1 GNAT family N-acetyltransferase [Streptomyces sp. ICBB 8177]
MRHVRGDDWDAIVALESAAYTPLGLSEGRAALESRVRASPATCFVLDLAERLAGYLLALPYPMFRYPDLTRAESVEFRTGNLHLHDLVVAEDLRGSGLAKTLLSALFASARSHGFASVSLVAVGGSAPFWASQGFTEHPGVVPPDGYGPGARYMSRPVRVEVTAGAGG